MPARSLDDCLKTLGGSAALHKTILSLAEAAVSVSQEIAAGALGEAFGESQGVRNAGGDEQKALDVYADKRFLEAAAKAPVAIYASEELDEPVLLDTDAPLAIAMDPLDGSSNIDTNVSIGTIFAILPVVGDPSVDALQSLLQPGSKQVAAGFFCYGPQLALVLTLGTGTHIFVYAPRAGAFLRTHADIRMPETTNEFAVNISNLRYWDDAIHHYISDCLHGLEGPHARDFNMRWIASLVAETYRILIRGGIFLYPGDRRKGYAQGRLRLVYEANPIALLVEQAGGLATDGVNPILSVVPKTLHERSPLIFGSSAEVREVMRYHTDLDHSALHPMLRRSPVQE